MSWAKEVKKACAALGVAYDGDNSEGFVPGRSSEPHLHCGKDHVTYTSVGHRHKSVADGTGLRQSAQEVYDTTDNDDIKRVVQYLQSNFR